MSAELLENRTAQGGAPSSDSARAAELIARIESVPFSRWHIRPRVIMGSATFFDAFSALSLASATPVLVREWGLSPAQVGYLLAASYIGQFAGALIFGWLGERIGRVMSATYATLIMAVVSLACAFTGNFSQMFVCRLIQGIGVGGEMPVAATYINELSRAHGRGRFFLLYELIFPIGFLAAAVSGAQLVPVYGWNVLFLIGTVPGLVIAYFVWRLPESPRWLIRKGRFAEAEAIIRGLEASTDKRNPVAAHAMSAAQFAQKSRWSELFSPLYRHRTLIVWAIWATAYGVTNGLNNWMPTLYNTVYHLPLQASLNFALLTNATQILILLVCVFVIDRIGRKAWMTASFRHRGRAAGALGPVRRRRCEPRDRLRDAQLWRDEHDQHRALSLHAGDLSHPHARHRHGCGNLLATACFRRRSDDCRPDDGVARDFVGVSDVRRGGFAGRARRDADDRDAQPSPRRHRALISLSPIGHGCPGKVHA